MKELILLIESESLLSSTCFKLLERERFNIISTTNGFIGLALAKEFQPDLIICDTNTLYLDGYRVKKIRDKLATFKIPCIFLTAETEIGSYYYYVQQLSGNDYLTKPIQSEKLLAAISRQLNKIQNQEVDIV